MGQRVESPDAAPWRLCVRWTGPPPVPDCHAILGVLDASAFTIAKRVLALVKAFLKAGVLTETGYREDSFTGTRQGGILTPPTQLQFGEGLSGNG